MAMDKSFRTSEIEYKINLSKHIDRIGMLFSMAVSERHTNLKLAQRIMVDNQITSINFLEKMLQPYLDGQYMNEIGVVKLSNDTLNDRQIYAEKKFGLLMELMQRKRMLIEETVEEVKEGIEEEISDADVVEV